MTEKTDRPSNQESGESKNDETKPAPWEREVNSMEEKKNVSFISGLALLLSILALVLIGWSGIADSPIQTEYKDYVEGKIDILNNRVDTMEETLKTQADGMSNGKLTWQIYKLQELEGAIGELTVGGADAYKAEYEKLQAQVKALQAKLNLAKTGGKPAAIIPEKAPAAKDAPKKEL